MKVLVVSDIHSNFEALEAVFDDAGAIDAVWCLGDITGYGPNPNEVIDLLRKADAHCIMGNHDAAVTGLEEYAGCEVYDYPNRRLIRNDHLAWLRALPMQRDSKSISVAHGSLRDPLWEYVEDPDVADASIEELGTGRVGVFVGHSHRPFISEEGSAHFLAAADYRIKSDVRFLYNPGSVGQPRDGDPRAAYGIFDTQARTISRRRVTYGVAAVQRKMREQGSPRRLIDRLSEGR